MSDTENDNVAGCSNNVQGNNNNLQPTGAVNLQDLIQALQNLQAPPNINNNSNLQFENFKEGEESFTVYKERLENFFQLKNIIEQQKKVQVLINCIGTKPYQLLSNLTAPNLPNTKTYVELTKLLSDHLCPVPDEVTEQHKFANRIQHEGESIANYVAELKKLSTYCSFKCLNCEASTLDTHLRSQFICGIRDCEIRERLLQEKNQNFADVLKTAYAIESAKNESRSMQSQNVHQIKNAPPKFTKYKKVISSETKIVCFRCGKKNHKATECRHSISDFKCYECGKNGHVASVCKNKNKRVDQNKTKVQSLRVDNNKIKEDSYSINKLQLYQKKCLHDPTGKILIKLFIESKPFTMEFDTGSAVTTINYSAFRELCPAIKIHSTNVRLRAYNQQSFAAIGECKVNVRFENIKFTGKMYIVKDGFDSICGRDWLNKFNILKCQNIFNITEIKSENEVQQKTDKILHDFSDVFEQKIGNIPNIQGKLKLREGANPIYIKPRPVPYAIRELIESEIDRLEEGGIFVKVKHSDWGTPIVPVIKKNKEIRLCADYKVTLNQSIVNDKYPIPKVEELYQKLKYGEYYCVLDVHKAYLHMNMSEESALMQTVSTHKGSYKVTKLMFGVKTAPNIWQRFIDENVVNDLDGTACFFDDIIVTGSSIQETDIRLRVLLQRLRDFDLHLNMDKCKLFKKSVTYLGHRIDKHGLHKTDEKIQSITNINPPTNINELRQFLGMINYYHKFIPDLSSKLYDLHKLLQKDVKFIWSEKCQRAFEKIKNDVISEEVLIPFDEKYPLILATDASPVGLSAVLSHVTPDGEKPIAFASRSLSKSESNYSQIDKEATAIFWSLHKFYNYCYGREFTLITDNKPLISIFSPSKCLPALTAQRLLHYAQFLSGFDYKIIYRNTKDHTNVDFLSRQPIQVDEEILKSEECKVFQLHEMVLPITSKTIANETRKDKELCILYNALQSGSSLNDTNFKGKEDELMIQDGCIYRGIRVIIPTKLQKQVLDELHMAHIGIVKMKSLARSYCYWFNIDKDIENIAKSCRGCAKVAKEPQKAPVHFWENPFLPWSRIHIDFAGPFMESYFLIVVDAKTKWLEVVTMKSITSYHTIRALREIFSRFGLPTTIVTDNGTNFTSSEFQNFLKSNGIVFKLTAPAHPATNGQAERYVQTVKDGLRSAENDPGDPHVKLHRLLIQYRKVINATTNKSPAEGMLRFNLRTRLDLIKKPWVNNDEISTNYELQNTRNYAVGEKVQIRYYLNKKIKWIFGEIIEKLGKLHYLIKSNDRTYKRHIDQIRSTRVTNDGEIQIPIIIRYENKNQEKPLSVPNTLCEEKEITTSNENSNNTIQNSTSNETVIMESNDNENNINNANEEISTKKNLVQLRRSKRVVKKPIRLDL